MIWILLGMLLTCLFALLLSVLISRSWRGMAMLLIDRHRHAVRLAEEECRVRLVYERALQLPVEDRRMVEQELWRRAEEGDELAMQIMDEMMNESAEAAAGSDSAARAYRHHYLPEAPF
jgi:hypothetical protein